MKKRKPGSRNKMFKTVFQNERSNELLQFCFHTFVGAAQLSLSLSLSLPVLHSHSRSNTQNIFHTFSLPPTNSHFLSLSENTHTHPHTHTHTLSLSVSSAHSSVGSSSSVSMSPPSHYFYFCPSLLLVFISSLCSTSSISLWHLFTLRPPLITVQASAFNSFQ